MLNLKIYFAVFFFISAWTLPLSAQPLPDDIVNFQKNNPDVNKYDFVKTYLLSLQYFSINAERNDKELLSNDKKLVGQEKTIVFIDNLVLDNVNLRVARNLLRKFKTPDNGLILKVIDLFSKLCDEQISFNNQEREWLRSLYDAQVNGLEEQFDKETFLKNQESLAAMRKESLKKLLEASILVSKVLISNELDEKNEFSRLGVSQDERKKLIDKLDELFKEDRETQVKEGQTMIEASVATIRSVLLDKSLKTNG